MFIFQVQVERTPANLTDRISGIVRQVNTYAVDALGHIYPGGSKRGRAPQHPPYPTHAQQSDAPRTMVQDKSWRCDAHPAWSRDFQAVVINARPTGQERQVMVLKLGSNLSQYFDPRDP